MELDQNSTQKIENWLEFADAIFSEISPLWEASEIKYEDFSDHEGVTIDLSEKTLTIKDVVLYYDSADNIGYRENDEYLVLVKVGQNPFFSDLDNIFLKLKYWYSSWNGNQLNTVVFSELKPVTNMEYVDIDLSNKG